MGKFTSNMKYITLYASILALASVALASGKQPCYNHADPDVVVTVLMTASGLPNYCACNDGTCWAISSHDCNPTSNVRLNPCPLGDP
ncbi:uncharacterized protein N7479_006072 [Penicillium vulpinum]|uniref:uncharacterized protein n=1 Tax=Penicillium vulpinum TaxID=29845 RepID=UPI002548DC15|nr:uncharacterized protein N7479_006072 [Penicillium vulpinum]KAJ5958922.1 hypothetical protein N7479_006072 [Penicillium vulpinum]